MLHSVTTRCFAALLGLVVAAPAGAQSGTGSMGRIVGRVVDAVSGQGISDVGVRIDGGAVGAVSGVDGRYVIANAPAGVVTLIARRLGYQAKTVTGIQVNAGRSTEQNVALAMATRQLEAQVVTASAERGTVADALDAQRNATGIVNSVTSEQIAKSPDSDAAQAVQRVSGVTVQDGKYVFVRGLGERYTTTTLNGARIPSPEPERKVVPLDLFPSGVIQSITTSKTFTPDQSGDFSGAQVDIRTREFPAQRQAVYSLNSGVNPTALGAALPAAPTTGAEWIAFAGSGRDVPSPVLAAGDFSGAPTQDQFNQMVRSFRNVWSPLKGSSTPNGSFSASLGGNDPVLFGRTLGYLGSITYSRGQEARAGEIRANAIPGAGGTVEQADQFVGSTGRTSVLAGGLLNLSTMLGDHSRLSLNNSYNRSSDNEARREIGFSEQFASQFRIDRLRYVERSVRSTQVAGEHDFGRQHADWAGTASAVGRREPDRSEIVYSIDADGVARWFGTSNEGAVRTFGDLSESSSEGRVNYRLAFADGPGAAVVKAGALYRGTNRDADNRAYSITANGLTNAARSLSPEQIFGGSASEPGSTIFRVSPIVQGGSYRATDRLGAGYLMGELNLGARVRLITGARVEHSRVSLTAQSTLGNAPVSVSPEYTDVLPSAAVNLKLTDSQTLRFSASQTLSRPEYRELAPVMYREVLGGDNVIGNESLRRSLIRNADVRWEWYPDEGEVFSVGAFAKRFTDPIERVYIPTSSTRVVTFVNSPTGNNLGLELEARKGLGGFAEWLRRFTLSANATVMRSAIRMTRADGITVRDRPMVGQAPYVVNTGLTYQREERGLSATMLFNTVGRRIYSASEADLPDVYEQERKVLDFSLRVPVLSGLAARLDVKNLLDSPYEIVQGTVVRERYSAGRIFQFGVTWR